ncbi:MAG: acyloxyacyl hydrolase [Bacteroidota bacterium]
MKGLITLIFLLVSTVLCGQFRSGGRQVISIDYMRGAIFEHKEQISHLITAHPWGVRLILNQKTDGTEPWQARYNYPDIGLTATYIDYNNDVLGSTLSLIPHYQFYLTRNREKRSQFAYKFGFGLAYNSEKYDRETNNKNNVLSTDISAGVLLEFLYQYKMARRLGVYSSISMTHFSNAALKKPNSGINVFSLNVGLQYFLSSKSTKYIALDENRLASRDIGYTFSLAGGAHEAVRINTGTDPFFVVSAFVDKTLNRKSKLGLGLEWFYSESLKNFKEEDYFLPENEDPDFNRIGLALSHELVINEFSIISQAGYYLYDPYSVFDPIYLRLGLRRYFGDHFFGSVAVKSHAAKAEAGEFAIGYRLK